MNDRYSHCYRALEIEPGCSFQDLKLAYRRLVRKWHPDRIAEKRRAKDSVYAEDKIKEITKAFRSLSEYYRTNGCLPSQPDSDNKPSTGKAPFRPAILKTPYSRSWRRKKNSSLSFAVRFTLAGAMAAVVIILWLKPWSETNFGINEPGPSSYPPPNAWLSGDGKSPVEPTTQNPSEDYFTEGSTLGEVIAIQGVPTATEEGVWHYGQSKIYFDKGLVVRWEQDSSSPLKANILLPPHSQQIKAFTLGSTKSEVRAAQGTPLRETENTWEYRVSRVQFKNGEVTDWFDSPLDPLKLTKQPSRR